MNGNGTNNLNSEAYCWRLIGIWADAEPSCPRLAEMIHCRNCPEFTAQGRALFDMSATADYLHEWQEFLAEERESVSQSHESVLVFRLGREWFAFRTAALKEVAEPVKIHRIPRKTEPSLLGLVNIKGELNLCFSLHLLLEVDSDSEASSPHRKFIILEKDGYSWVFPVDEIAGISRYDMNEVGNIPVTVLKSDTNYIKEMFRFEGRSTAYLDDELIIYSLRRRIS